MPESKSNSLDSQLSLLGFAKWPFGVVPDPDSEVLWADREDLERRFRRLLRRLYQHDSSSLHLFWADFGAGKTHTLLYAKQIIQNEMKGCWYPLVAVLPHTIRSFINIYQAIVRPMGVGCLQNIYTGISSGGKNRDSIMADESNYGLIQVLRGLTIGNDKTKNAALRWILADPSLTRQELRDSDLPDKIRSADDAVRVLSSMINLLNVTGYNRVFIMVDEFQRMGSSRGSTFDEVNSCLHTVFNNNPRGLSLLLSFSIFDPKQIDKYLNTELKSRSDPQTLTLPSLDRDQSEVFLSQLVEKSSIEGSRKPFGQDVIKLIVDHVQQAVSRTRKERSNVGQNTKTVTPRRLILTAGHLFSEASMDLADGVIQEIDTKYAQRILDEMDPLALTEPE